MNSIQRDVVETSLPFLPLEGINPTSSKGKTNMSENETTYSNQLGDIPDAAQGSGTNNVEESLQKMQESVDFFGEDRKKVADALKKMKTSHQERIDDDDNIIGEISGVIIGLTNQTAVQNGALLQRNSLLRVAVATMDVREESTVEDGIVFNTFTLPVREYKGSQLLARIKSLKLMEQVHLTYAKVDVKGTSRTFEAKRIVKVEGLKEVTSAEQSGKAGAAASKA